MFDFIAGLFGPVEKLIDTVVTSDEERLQLRNELTKIQAGMQAKSVELMKAEVQSENMLVSGWRPACVVILISLVVADAYGWAKAPQQVYDLANMFLTTYAGSRGLEKITRTLKK